MARKAQTQTGKRAIRAIFADARDQLAAQADMPAADANDGRPDPDNPDRIIRPGKWRGYPYSWPPKALCPVQVVGRDADGLVYCVTATGHLRAIDRFDDRTIADLFAPRAEDAMFLWPAWAKAKREHDPDTGEVREVPPRVDRIETKKAMLAIIQEAARKGDFDPSRQQRGRGGWRTGDGGFVWHSGHHLWVSDAGKLRRADPSMLDGHLYTRQLHTLDPWPEPVTAEESPARQLLTDLRTWKWDRPYIDPLFVVGWLAVALMGGALRQRPHVFTTGGYGIGKTTMQELLSLALGPALLKVDDTTAAFLYQTMKRDSLPVMLDELERKPGSSRATAVIEIMRLAYSGGEMGRGGAEGEPTGFTARSAFFASAINPPKMLPQDKSRMAVLSLSKLDRMDGIGPRSFVSREEDGRMMLRQVMDGWRDFDTRCRQDYWKALQEQGLDARACDTFATLLAACELLVGPDAMEDVGLDVTDHRRLGEIVAQATALERAETLDPWHACLNRLLLSQLEFHSNGQKPTVGQTLDDHRGIGGGDRMTLNYAQDRLATVNLGLRKAGHDGTPGAGPWLCVPMSGPALEKVFAGTDWEDGGWWNILKQAPADVVIRHLGNGQKQRIGGSVLHCLLVDLPAFESWVAKRGEG